MPMIDVYAAADLFPAHADRDLAAELVGALLRAEGMMNPGPTHTNNTAAYIPSPFAFRRQYGGARQRAHPSRPGPDASRHAVSRGAEAARRRPDADRCTDRGRPEPGRQNLGAPHGSGRGRLGNCRHGVWARGIRCARGEQEIVTQIVQPAVGGADERMAG
jgi:hypothetical protein